MMATDKSVTHEERKTEGDVAISYISNDPVILDAFADVKAAILAKRNDIVRQILAAAQSMRDENDFDSDVEEEDKKRLCDKYDSEEYCDILSMLLCHQDTDSGTLLHYATRIDSADIVRTLLAAGANVTVKNGEGLNSYAYCKTESMRNAYIGELMQAVSQSRTFRVQQMLNAGIDVNSTDGARSANTVLHWAVSFADINTVKLLIENGADVNSLNADGVSPLHDAINRTEKDLVEELLRNGACQDMRPYKGKYEGISSKELARTLPSPDIFSLLEQYAVQETINGRHDSGVHSSANCDGIHEVNGESNGEMNDLSLGAHKEKLQKRLSSTSASSSKSHSLCLPSTQKLDELANYLCPPPQKIRQFEGLCFVPPSELLIIVTAPDRIVNVRSMLEVLEDRFVRIGIKIHVQHTENVLHNEKSTHLHCVVNKTICPKLEEYKVQVNTHKVTVVSGSIKALYRGVTTFLQCLQLFRGKAVPLLQISDWSLSQQRSVILDIYHNDLPSTEILYETVNLLSFFKVNQLQFSMEHVTNLHGNMHYTKQEFFNLQVFCQKRYIDVVAYIKLNESSPLLSMEPGTDLPCLNEIKLDKIINEFIDKRFLHININHPDQIRLLQHCHYFCTRRAIQLQVTMATPFAMNLDQSIYFLQGFTGFVDVAEVTDVEEKMSFYETLGFPTVLCYDTDKFDRLYPNIQSIIADVYEISSQLSTYDCEGLAVKLSYPSRRLCNFSTCLSTLFIALSFGWNRYSRLSSSLIENIINYLVYEDDNDVIGSFYIKLGQALPLSNGRIIFDDMLAGSYVDYSILSNDWLQEKCRVVKTAKQDLSNVKLRAALAHLVTEENTIALNLIYFLSRICYGMLNLQSSSANISDLNVVHKSDNSNRLLSIIKEYEDFCRKYYKLSHHPSTGLSADNTSVALLKELLRQILPPNNAPTQGFFGAFTV